MIIIRLIVSEFLGNFLLISNNRNMLYYGFFYYEEFYFAPELVENTVGYTNNKQKKKGTSNEDHSYLSRLSSFKSLKGNSLVNFWKIFFSFLAMGICFTFLLCYKDSFIFFFFMKNI